MAEPSPSADPLSTKLPGAADASESALESAPKNGAPHSRFKQKKLVAVLGAAALGGVLLGVGGMTLIAYLQPAGKSPQVTPDIAAPAPHAEQGKLVTELKELKAKNEKLEEQLKQSSTAAPISALAHDLAQLPPPAVVSALTPIAVQAPIPTILHRRSAARGKAAEKVTADCTVPDKEEKLGEKLKSCIEDFNASTH